ncbi:hypothetical protein [Sulfitobacter sabulilitoris]|uniref:Uncharacterized protein n=1 Tax=Sulfitobacter sabulilitoris TaxID=2562655 RepID=A0A5S3PIN6_9RHOB|nr:hypothetical protein [Sulfitobacter sabulilitoris]TMM51845.1 hypothetical protein FDT80_13965 [Sulfitobacter sabulilitoris]
MTRLFLFLALLVVVVAISAVLVSIWVTAYDAGRAALRPIFASGTGGAMTPTGFQKIAYLALLLLLVGVTTGWLGGL